MAKKDRNRHNIWKKLHFKYRLAVLNENTLEEVWKLRVSMFNGVMLYFASFVVLMIISSTIIISTPLRNYLPGYLDSEIREQAIRTAIQIDSLAQKQKNQETYIQNIKDIFEGKVELTAEGTIDTVMISTEDKSLQSTDRENKFRAEYEESEKYNLSTFSSTDASIGESVTFFRPIKGLVSDKFNLPARFYGVQIVPASESVVATLEGSIMYTGYDAETNKYVIQLQHKNGFTSIYRGVSMLLKKTGDKVRTGEAIGLMSLDENKIDRKKLQFELWHKGDPVNPELYISFL